MTDKENRQARAHSGPIDDLLGITDQALRYLEEYRMDSKTMPPKADLDAFLLIARTEYQKYQSNSDHYTMVRDKINAAIEGVMPDIAKAMGVPSAKITPLSLPGGMLGYRVEKPQSSEDWDNVADSPFAFETLRTDLGKPSDSPIFPPNWIMPAHCTFGISRSHNPQEVAGLIYRHICGNWGDADQEDVDRNNAICSAIHMHHESNLPLEDFDFDVFGGGIISVHALEGRPRVLIMTTPDGTLITLPEECEK